MSLDTTHPISIRTLKENKENYLSKRMWEATVHHAFLIQGSTNGKDCLYKGNMVSKLRSKKYLIIFYTYLLT